MRGLNRATVMEAAMAAGDVGFFFFSLIIFLVLCGGGRCRCGSSFQRSALAERWVRDAEGGAETKEKWRCPRQRQADPLEYYMGLLFLVWAFKISRARPKGSDFFFNQPFFFSVFNHSLSFVKPKLFSTFQVGSTILRTRVTRKQDRSPMSIHMARDGAYKQTEKK